MAYRKNFHPWRQDLAGAGLFFAFSVLSLRSADANPLYVLPALGFGWAAWLALKSYSRRTHGKRVEHAALIDLRKACSWAVAVNVPVPGGGGDIDAVVEGPRRFAVEIKSWAGLRIRRGRLVRASGRPTGGRDPIAQCLREANAIGAVAVLWLPTAKRTSAFEHRGVLVVNGPARFLNERLHSG
ncbi:hypothetical protein BMS3Bbin13_00089 [bacterium BMS3Bbin13]|nr:hypothetical protein BMS3Bbin13_00089 [bacterium BMS3Bbin13]